MNIKGPAARQLFNFLQGSEITQESAYDIWKRLGNEDGTEAEFLEFLRSGPKGETGQSVYEEWVSLEENKGKSFSEFITSLKGEKGDKGDTGDRGATGIPGTNGATGPQGLKGDKGDTGDKGETGATGKSAYEIWKDAGNSGTVTEFLASLKGEKGDKGDKGATGATGADGATGATGANGAAGKSAYEIWKAAGNTGTEAQFLASLKGAKGDIGDKGETGAAGKSAYEIWRAAGNTGSEAQFLASLKGTNGAAAGFGTPTATVDANVGTPSVTITSSGADTSKVFNFAFKNLKGEKGDTGPQGPQGEKGDTGPQGEKGNDGDSIKVGDTYPTATEKKLFLKIDGSLDPIPDQSTISKSDIIDIVYPIGSLYMSVNSANPSTFIGGTWERWGQGKTIIGVNETDTDFSEAEKTGGEKNHTLTANEIPSHAHSVGAHSHGLNNHTHSVSITSGSAGNHTHSIPKLPVSMDPAGKHVHKGYGLDDRGSGTGTRIGSSSATAIRNPTITLEAGEHTHNAFIPEGYLVSESADHTHSVSGTTGAASGSTANSTAFNTSATGGGAAHNNLPPYITCYIWKRTA